MSEEVIDEHHAMAYETIITDLDHLADERMRLDLGAPADPHSPLDFHEGTNEATVSQLALVEIDGLNDFHRPTANDVADTRAKNLWRSHRSTPTQSTAFHPEGEFNFPTARHGFV